MGEVVQLQKNEVPQVLLSTAHVVSHTKKKEGGRKPPQSTAQVQQLFLFATRDIYLPAFLAVLEDLIIASSFN